MYCLIWLLRGDPSAVLKFLMVLIDYKGYFQDQKGPILDLCYLFWAYISENGACCECLYEVHIQSHI